MIRRALLQCSRVAHDCIIVAYLGWPFLFAVALCAVGLRACARERSAEVPTCRP